MDCIYGWVVVKLHREDECLDSSDESEDSDWESETEQASEPAPEKEVDSKDETEHELRPLLMIGSSAR